LLRQGFSNQEIAAALQLSLSGAKFHVSEIITKLGVRDRREAASWEGERRNHGIMPGIWKLPELSIVARALVALGTTATVAVAGLTFVPGDNVSSLFARSEASPPTATPSACWRPGCFVITPQEFTTLAEAEAVASFRPMVPANIPAGFHLYKIQHSRPFASARDVHNDWITVSYLDKDGHSLVISQGFPAFPGVGYYESAPDGLKGEVDGTGAYWARGVGLLASAIGPSRGGTNSEALMLTWEAGRFGAGWELTPSGELLTGSPFSYSILSDILSLDELLSVASSIAPQ
jgi:hypothetical protein